MWERFCKIRKKLRIYGRFQLFSTNFVNNLGRMPVPPLRGVPIPPTTWGVWYGRVRDMGRMPIPPNI